jgi:ubiquinone/menaquinone biosynthesis C-methylase UbiE
MREIKESAIKQFSRQAGAYSKGIFADRTHLSEIIRRSCVTRNNRVLDIAAGSGFLAIEFAKLAEKVIGADITRNMLLQAREKQKDSGLENIGFILSDVESLPFAIESFNIVSCRFAFHHFPDPMKALREMKRVCKNQGKIVLVDGVSSENSQKSLFHNRIERLRDPSHVRIYKLSEIEQMFNGIDAAIKEISHWDMLMDFEDWMKRAGTREKEKTIIEESMKGSIEGDSTGLHVNLVNGRLVFTYDTVILIAQMHRG